MPPSVVLLAQFPSAGASSPGAGGGSTRRWARSPARPPAFAAPPGLRDHVHGLLERCRRPGRGGDDAGVRGGAEAGRPLAPRRRHRPPPAEPCGGRPGLPGQGPRGGGGGQEEEGPGQEEPPARRGPGGQAGPEERGQRPREGSHARPQQSLLPPQDHPALGAARHQALQAGHPPPGLQLHRPPAPDPGQRQVRERLHPPRQPDVALYGCWQTRERAERSSERHSVVWSYSILTLDFQAC